MPYDLHGGYLCGCPIDKLIASCICNWERAFMNKLRRDSEDQRKRFGVSNGSATLK